MTLPREVRDLPFILPARRSGGSVGRCEQCSRKVQRLSKTVNGWLCPWCAARVEHNGLDVR